uniref:Uncharacterized protein n=1 Tax=Timema shepardi TaxID=629360 RepID=A0A7R9G2Y4_TIMSH|nr:unnamed protein product [Timema shepardi]
MAQIFVENSFPIIPAGELKYHAVYHSPRVSQKMSSEMSSSRGSVASVSSNRSGRQHSTMPTYTPQHPRAVHPLAVRHSASLDLQRKDKVVQVEQLTPRKFLDKYSLPRVVRVMTEPQGEPLFSGGLGPLAGPLLLYRQYRSTKVQARSVPGPKDVTPVGPSLVIPDCYQGERLQVCSGGGRSKPPTNNTWARLFRPTIIAVEICDDTRRPDAISMGYGSTLVGNSNLDLPNKGKSDKMILTSLSTCLQVWLILNLHEGGGRFTTRSNEQDTPTKQQAINYHDLGLISGPFSHGSFPSLPHSGRGILRRGLIEMYKDSIGVEWAMIIDSPLAVHPRSVGRRAALIRKLFRIEDDLD